jgi:hypothetical protein
MSFGKVQAWSLRYARTTVHGSGMSVSTTTRRENDAGEEWRMCEQGNRYRAYLAYFPVGVAR